MPAIIKNSFRLQSAKHFLENFEKVGIQPSGSSSYTPKQQNYYLFVGKPFSWDTTNVDTNRYDELNPPPPNDTLFEQGRVWDEMLGLKKITKGDVTLVIPRHDWRKDTIYAMFDDRDPELFHRPTAQDIAAAPAGKSAGSFYVLNNAFELFICVNNNDGTASTQVPTRPDDLTKTFTLSDGYEWKYITTITSGDAVKFLTDSWIPLRTILGTSDSPQKTVQDTATPGQLLRVAVTNLNDTSVGTFEHVYKGEISVITTSNPKDAQVYDKSAQTSPPTLGTPAPAGNDYVGYQLHITGPAGSANIGKVFDIEAYEIAGTVPTIRTSQDLVAAGLAVGVVHQCEILPKLVVKTNGTGIKIKPRFNEFKKLVGVDVLNKGQNATSIVIDVIAPGDFAESPNTATSKLPKVRGVLSPVDGLGKDPEKDLGAGFVMISTQLKYAEGAGDFPVANDYRQIGILKNVKKWQTTSGVTSKVFVEEDTLMATKSVRVQFQSTSDLGVVNDFRVGGFDSDELLEIRTPSGDVLGQAKVVEFKGPYTESGITWGTVSYIQSETTGFAPISATLWLYGLGNSNARAVVLETVPEECVRFEGEMLYLENRRAVLRSTDQLEDVKTIIEF